jgi:hypothetical protein
MSLSLCSTLLLLFVTLTYANSAEQTDWSGGPGVQGPFLDWETTFNLSFHVFWNTPGSISLAPVADHLVDGSFVGASSVYAEDVDRDGDMDVLGAATVAYDLTWWENADGTGTDWVEHSVDEYIVAAGSVYAEDVDGDGDMDVLGAAGGADDIIWWSLSGYKSHGYLESSILDTQSSNLRWDFLLWDATSPVGTSVSFQVRGSDLVWIPGAWSDTLTVPGSLSGILQPGDRYMQYRAILRTTDPNVTPLLDEVTVTWGIVGVSESTGPVPQGYALLLVAPNPSRAPSISFTLPEPSPVTLIIHDLTGRRVRTWERDRLSAGLHEIELEMLPPGVYFCRMTAGTFTETRRFVVE